MLHPSSDEQMHLAALLHQDLMAQNTKVLSG
jgi:hypothetical protein